MKKLIVGGATLLLFTIHLYGQGCVAVRPMSCSASGQGNGLGIMQKGQFQVTGAYRYFKSFRHFRGDEEETERVENGTEVINLAHALDLGISYAFHNRMAVTVNLPLIYNDRSSLYEHYGNSTTANPDQARFHTFSQGIGDMRAVVNYWLFNPSRDSLMGNISVGIGLKTATGNSNVQDEFHKRASDGSDSIITKAVDQSIQKGDGGWGANIELQAFRKFGKSFVGYFNGFYLLNPMNTNKTLNRGTLVGVDPLIAYHSIADQYAARLGMIWALLPHQGLSISLGGRIEGIPAKDLIGKSEGWRRPGYIVSWEPGINWMFKTFNATLTVPTALYRNRTKNTYDLADPTGQRHGDAAFANYLINLIVSYRFGKTGNSSVNPGVISR